MRQQNRSQISVRHHQRLLVSSIDIPDMSMVRTSAPAPSGRQSGSICGPYADVGAAATPSQAVTWKEPPTT